MRVALVGPTHPYKGGGAQHTTELAHRLENAGHEVTLLSWRAQYPGWLYPGRQTVEEPEGEPFGHTLRWLSWRRPDGWWRTGRRIATGWDVHAGQRKPYDLLVLSLLSPVQVPPYLGILRGCRCSGIPVLALCHNVLPHERRAADVALVRALLRRVTRVLVHSAEQAAVARSLTGSPVTVAVLPPHLPARLPGAATLPAQPRQISTSPQPPAEPHRRVLFFGLVRPYKGLDVLIRALARGPHDIQLRVAGEFWTGLTEIRALIRELGLTERVDLRPGYVPAARVAGLFQDVDALVLPYRSATASQNVWLAHAHGVPAIATRVGALSAGIHDGVDGLLCEPGDVDALAETLRRLYTPPAPASLRAGVRAGDPQRYWDPYLTALAGGTSADPHQPRKDPPAR